VPINIGAPVIHGRPQWRDGPPERRGPPRCGPRGGLYLLLLSRAPAVRHTASRTVPHLTDPGLRSPRRRAVNCFNRAAMPPSACPPALIKIAPSRVCPAAGPDRQCHHSPSVGVRRRARGPQTAAVHPAPRPAPPAGGARCCDPSPHQISPAHDGQIPTRRTTGKPGRAPSCTRTTGCPLCPHTRLRKGPGAPSRGAQSRCRRPRFPREARPGGPPPFHFTP
jgi:hypothetical protein